MDAAGPSDAPIPLACPKCRQLMAFYEERLPDRIRTYECQEHGFFTFTCHRLSAPQAVERNRRLIGLYASLRNSGVLTIHGRGYPQRDHWSGEPARLGESWRLHKSGCQPAKEAICRLQSHVFGWELILEINGSLYASQVCRNSEVLTTQEQWKKAMIEKGWR